jgi:protein involved in polysaccharide export with SLBB domain
MTLAQFEAMVLREYGRHFRQIQGRVTLDRIRSLQVMVAGDAMSPGLYTISALSTAFNAIYQAGGPTPRGSMRRIALIRNGEQIATIDLYDYLLTGRRVQDYALEPGDTLFVPVVGAVVGIKGCVKRPALYELAGGERLRDLIEMAGGVRAATYLDLVQIERIRDHSERVLADVDVSALVDGDDTHNLKLRDGDLIAVGSVLDRRANSVELLGRVARPGLYELKPGMRVKDLVAEAQGTLGEVDMTRAEILRIEPDETTRLIPFALGKALEGDPQANLALQPGDQVTIYAPGQVQRRRKVSIGGAVQRPGTYDRLAGMRLADLVFALSPWVRAGHGALPGLGRQAGLFALFALGYGAWLAAAAAALPPVRALAADLMAGLRKAR